MCDDQNATWLRAWRVCEEASIGVEVSESTSFSSSLERRASLLGEYKHFFALTLRLPLDVNNEMKPKTWRQVMDGSARCQAVHRRGPVYFFQLRLCPVMDSVPQPKSGNSAAKTRPCS